MHIPRDIIKIIIEYCDRTTRRDWRRTCTVWRQWICGCPWDHPTRCIAKTHFDANPVKYCYKPLFLNITINDLENKSKFSVFMIETIILLGIRICKRADILLIDSTDSDATLEANGNLCRLGKGQFIIPTRLLGFTDLVITHHGPCKLTHYRAVNYQYMNALDSQCGVYSHLGLTIFWYENGAMVSVDKPKRIKLNGQYYPEYKRTENLCGLIPTRILNDSIIKKFDIEISQASSDDPRLIIIHHSRAQEFINWLIETHPGVNEMANWETFVQKIFKSTHQKNIEARRSLDIRIEIFNGLLASGFIVEN